MKKCINSILCLFVFGMSMNLKAASVRGEVDSVLNSYLTGDNYFVTLKPGWTGTPCGGNTNQSAPIQIGYLIATHPSPAQYERNFTLVTAAAVAGSTVTLYTLSNDCNDGFSVKIE